MGKVEQRAQIKKGDGFVAALDQSGGSTPKALGLYGIGADAYSSDDEMFDLIHGMRARIIKSPAFNGDRIVGAILFEMTMDREIDGTPTAEYLWNTKGVVPFLKVDKGLEDAVNGAKLMKPIDGLDATLDRALAKGIYGTKMRSVIDAANPAGIAANVAQQFEIGKSILAKGLMPILEPEVTISIPDKPEAEAILRAEILEQLDALPEGAEVMLKLSLPSSANHYKDVIDHPKVLKVVALSGGYSRDEANALLAQNAGMIASFSRALTEGLNADQSEDDFNALLDSTIASIKAASVAG